MKRKADSARAQQDQRSAFNRQPARILLVDLQSSLAGDDVSNLCDAMENVLAMVSTLSGPNRIPFFGVVVLHDYPEVLFPLSTLRGNFARLTAALNDIRRFHKDRSGAKGSSSGLISEAIKEGLTMFRRQAQGLLQTAGYWAQLELTFVTGQQNDKITKILKTVIQQLDLDGLKKIQVLSFNGDDQLCLADNADLLTSQASVNSGGSNDSHDSSGMVDSVNIDNSVLGIEGYIMSWLHDTGTDLEHAHIILPTDDAQQPLTLKCDLQERIINPNCLPFSNYFDLGVDVGGYKSGHQPNVRTSSSVLPIRKLKVLQKIPSDAICESVLYGMPLVARATSCWKIDWDELEVNQQHFQALCQLLTRKNEVLLAQLESEMPVHEPVGFRYSFEQPKPSGMFLLLPSQRGSLLIKSIVTREFLLPLDITGVDQVPEASLNDVERSLDKLHILDSYNPLLTESNLHKSLVAQLTKNMPGASSIRPKALSSKQAYSGTNLTAKSGFTPAKWAMQNAANQRKPAESATDFYSKSARSCLDDFPTTL